ncbi:HAMP domain-containing protein, partial [candidate division WOR-3 bacterium]|nr:HAMP domain-containing protein [candidate division WOR-3 bacterium]
MKRDILLRLLAIQLSAIFLLLVIGLVAARGTGRTQLLVGGFLAVAAAAVVVTYLAAQSTVRPIRDLTEAFRRFSAGELDVRVLPARRGRLRELGDSFNQMAFRTKTVVAELRQQREALDAVVGSMQEGLAVVDSAGRVIMANSSFRRLAGESEPIGMRYWEVLREPDFVELVRSVNAEDSTATRQLAIRRRDFTCSASYLSAARQVVLTFHDDTQVFRSARLKRDFVQNVSHELRTPLTAIKGFAETLEATIDDANRPYLETIQRHTDRLISLVKDLLTLSELEERGAELRLEDVDLKAAAAQVLKLFESQAAAKGLRLGLTAGEPDAPGRFTVRADRFKLEQVLINLLDNAVKYTEKGSVELLLGADPGVTGAGNGVKRFLIEVRDTGSGIAPEHLPRLFERFYVVDRGRSRQLGGTGLGLAIVKHIVLLHGGDVTVQSTPGAGTTFQVRLPA